MPERQFTRARIILALAALGEELTAEGIRGQVFIVGGAAMALAYSTRRVTRDIDAVFEPKTAIYEAAGRVAARLGLPEDWLNDGVKGFLPGADRDAIPLRALTRRSTCWFGCTRTASRQRRPGCSSRRSCPARPSSRVRRCRARRSPHGARLPPDGRRA